MDEMIFKKAAIEVIGKVPDYGDGMVFEAISHAQRDVALLPSVDAVPVRCKNCKYSYIFEPWEGKDAVRYCNQLRHAYAKDSDLPVREEGFCSMGERREE